jgi:uncharacterized glyoxalase superfamily protein PhnB
VTEATYDVIEVRGDIESALQWCQKTFGPQSKKRWFVSNHRFYFLQAKDAMLFELRW